MRTHTPTISQMMQKMLKDMGSRFGLERGTAPNAQELQKAFYKHLKECLGRHWEIEVAWDGQNAGRVMRLWKARPRKISYNLDTTYTVKCFAYESMHIDVKETLDAFLPIYEEWKVSGVVQA